MVVVRSEDPFLPCLINVLSPPPNCITSGFWIEHAMSGPGCVNTFAMTYRLELSSRALALRSDAGRSPSARGDVLTAACAAFPMARWTVGLEAPRYEHSAVRPSAAVQGGNCTGLEHWDFKLHHSCFM